MTRSAVITWLLSFASLAAADRPDLLRFTNGDQLHGSFVGIKEGPQTVWQRDDLGAPIDFKTERIRHIILHGGRAIKPLESLSNVSLVNGDRIPGIVTGIDADQVILDTVIAGELRIPRAQVAMLSPNPLGGRVYYHGPFSEDDWKMTSSTFPNGLPLGVLADAEENGAADSDTEKPPGRWVFSGSAWYWQAPTPGTALIRKSGMPDRAILSFDLAWRKRLSLAVAFHADFARPMDDEDENDKKRQARAFSNGDTSVLPHLFGNSYVLQLTSNSMMLYRTSVDEEGSPSLERVQLSNNSLRLGDTGRARLELRSNRGSGAVTLFVDGEFVAQWNENDLINLDNPAFSGKGSGFGFVSMSSTTSARVSDIIVSEWNGMPDSARSLQMDEHDVVLMANGTDRYSGKVSNLDEDGRVHFEGKHGSFKFPLDEVAEVRFASNQLATTGDRPADNIIVRLKPIGTISGRPISGDGSTLKINSPIIGEVNLSMDAAVMLDFNASNHFIDDWDANF